jgi:hypothetical protein
MKKMHSIKHVLIIFNPASTNAKRLARRIDELKQQFDPSIITLFETSKEGREANKKLILTHKELLGPDSLLCIAAGDGTVNLVIETLLTSPEISDADRATPILPLWGGNANDLAHMLNGYPWRRPLRNIFRRGKVTSINPLRITLTREDTSTVKIAACYASFGAMAYAANRINKPAHRHKPFTGTFGIKVLIEFYTVTRAFLKVQTYRLIENGELQTMYEYAMINGSRIAKIERMPVSLTDNAFYVAKISRKHPVAFLYVLRVLRQKRFGRITNRARSFTLVDDTWLQMDGEVMELEAGTKVDIMLNPRPFKALTKRLR